MIVTDLLSNTQFDIGANTANGEAKGSGMDLVDLHMVNATLACESASVLLFLQQMVK